MRADRGSDARVFLGPLEISGYYSALEAGFLELGVDARLVTLHPNPFGYAQAAPNPWPARWSHRIILAHRRVPAPLRLVTGAAYVLASLSLLLWAIPRYSHFVFSWGTTILPRQLDLPLLRRLGKNITVVVGHGSEARPPYMSTPAGSLPLTAAQLSRLASSSAAIAARLHRIERHAHHVIGLPTTSQFLSEPFVDFYALGIPTPASIPVPVAAPDAAFVILHVPSKPEVKGTARIRLAVDEVLARNPEARYVELSGRPHHEVLEAIASASLVIDQLWSDIPMAVVGTEAAAAGRPTLIGGYSWDIWRARLSEAATPPTFWCEPERLVDAIEERLADREGTRATGERARDFVTRDWAPVRVAGRYIQVFDGSMPAEWTIEPRSVVYGYGCGVVREHVDSMVGQLVARYGESALRWRDAVTAYHLENSRS